MTDQIPATARKDTHIDLALTPLAKPDIANSMDRLNFIHCALPECDLDGVDLATQFYGKALSAPIMIGAMTGGTPRAAEINAALATVAQSHKIAFAVGSQRAALELGQSASNLRNLAPDVVIIGNLGGIQLARPNGIDLAKAAVDDLAADAIAIHLNPLQEAVQPEGERDWRGVRDAIGALVTANIAPVIVKEVGAGINAKLAAELFDMGVSTVDIAGVGGTNWARIEAARRRDSAVFAPFLDWGMTTMDCLLDIRNCCPGHSIIASGGIRHGLDAMRAYWLGADMVSLAGAMLSHLIQNDARPDPEMLSGYVDVIKQQMKLAAFLTGAAELGEFRKKPAQLDGHPL